MEKKIELAKKYFQAINDKNLDLLDEVIHVDFVPFSTLDSPSIQYDRPSFFSIDGAKKLVNGYLLAFPDLHVEIISITTNFEEVVINFIASGTHKGEFFGIASTGRKFESEYYQRFKIKDEKIIGSALLTDGLNIFTKLGQAVLLQNEEDKIKEYYNVLRKMGLIKST
ncbi:MAG: ester cyclase [Candidatus Kariarchaeaceae archaeon]|jgi:predicted ester cyclase